MVDNGISPDLSHREVSIAPFRRVTFYHPPWPVVLVDVVDQFGVIRDTLCTTPTPPEIEAPANQFPPESTHEIDGAPTYGTPPEFLAAGGCPSSRPRISPATPDVASPRTPRRGSPLHPCSAGNPGRIYHRRNVIAQLTRNESPGSDNPFPGPTGGRCSGYTGPGKRGEARRRAVLLDTRPEVNPQAWPAGLIESLSGI